MDNQTLIKRSPEHIQRLVEGRAAWLAVQKSRAYDEELRRLSTNSGMADYLRKMRGKGASSQRTIRVVGDPSGQFAAIFQGGKGSGMGLVMTDGKGKKSVWVKRADDALHRVAKGSAAERALIEKGGNGHGSASV